MSEVKVNKITPTTNCGTVTLGDSGDTVAIPCGVTLSNSGSITNSGIITNTGTISGGTITGTIDNQVNWDTTAKTAGFTAVAGNGYFVNTTSGAITVTLPATPSAGDLVGIKDYANTANTNNITIDRNGEPIQGTANNFTISVAGTSITLIYVDGTQGWVSTGAAKASDISEQALFTVATGGCITTCGDFKIHTFTGPGTFCVSQVGNCVGGPSNVDYLVIAGGGSGGGGNGYYGGGGGAGGYRTTFPSPGCNAGTFPITATAFPIQVGAGGAQVSTPCGEGNSGSNSIFSSITSTGGGGGTNLNAGNPGGSGGGAIALGGLGGTGNTPPVSPPQGNPGGDAQPGNQNCNAGGGGGGAGAAGTNVVRSGGPGTGGVSTAGPGGNGSSNSITGSAVTRAGGGGGGVSLYPPGPGGNSNLHTAGDGGTGGGGDGGSNGPAGGRVATAGSANTGGGGGGSGQVPCSGKAGGSGIVIIRYKYQ
jgi:hypothetical protein